MMSYDLAYKALPALNWNELSEIIKDANEFLLEMEGRAIGVMENAQDIMREKHTRRFPREEQEALHRYLGLGGNYDEITDVMRYLTKRKRIKYAVAAFAEGTNRPVTSEYKIMLRELYGCEAGDEPTTPSWQEARERFWKEFEEDWVKI